MHRGVFGDGIGCERKRTERKGGFGMQKTKFTWKSIIEKIQDCFRGKAGIVRIVALLLALLLLVLAVLTFLSVGKPALVTFSKIVAVFMGILMIALGAELVLLAFAFGEDTPNFFLYDVARGRNLPVSQLTAEGISRRMDAYFSRFVKNKGQLWLPGYLEKCDFGRNAEFRPIAAYKMLLDLAEINSDGGWRCFSASSPATVQWIADSLRAYEPQMMKDVLYIKAKFGADPSKIRDCLLRNAPYLRKRMTAYFTENLAAFRGMK